jgi:hypothetical protein
LGLAGPGWAQEDDVLRLPEEVQLVEVGDLLAAQRPLVGEVEVVEGLCLRESSRLDPVLPAVGLSGGDLFRQQLG